MIKVLVTGAGAVLGQGILRCLQSFEDKFEIQTCDPDWRSTGHWLGMKAHKIPLATDTSFILEIEKIIESEKIDIVLVGTDSELPLFAVNKERIEKKFPVKILVSSNNVISIANNKWETANFLRDNNFPFPESYMSYDNVGISKMLEDGMYPYFAKPVDGARSKGIKIINSEADLKEISSYPNNLVVQEYIPEDSGEFTSGCIVFNGICKAVVTLRRDLRDGNTYRAYYDNEYSKYDDFISEVACKLGVEGPCNFQFRIKNNRPVIFEINSRFSGTTPIRNYFGFNEVKSVLDFLFFNIEIERPNLKEGVVMRAWSDIFVEKIEYERVLASNVSDNLKCTYHNFK